MAERLCKCELKKIGNKNIKVLSRGLNASGENITENAKLALKKLGASAANRKSVKLGKIDSGTLYVTMTNAQTEKIKGKVISFAALIGNDVIDPYGQDLDTYVKTAEQLQRGVKVLLNKILLVERRV